MAVQANLNDQVNRVLYEYACAWSAITQDQVERQVKSTPVWISVALRDAAREEIIRLVTTYDILPAKIGMMETANRTNGSVRG